MKQKHYMQLFKICYTILIILFITLNYAIIGHGHAQTYDRETNNCTHMSRQLEGLIENIGIPVTLKTGARDGGNRHMWISLWNTIELDSKNLLPFQNSRYNIDCVDYVSFDEYEKTRLIETKT